MSDLLFDVAVVGGGPAGATCARDLALAGIDVVVLDKAPPPRYKTCGGGLVARARQAIGLDLAGVIEHECHAVAMNLVRSGLGFEVRRDLPLVTMTMRAALDERLLDAARLAGATVVTPFDLSRIDARHGEVTLQSRAGETCTARHVVAADGALSATARGAGWPGQAPGIPALESEIRVDAATFERLRAKTRFDFEVVPAGYGWLFPKRDHLSVGVLSTRRGARSLRGTLDDYLLTLGIERVEARDDHGYVIPTRPRDGGLVRGRILLTGDAAGLADPLTGEGISHAVTSAKLAAQAIVAAFDAPDRVGVSYSAAVDREVLADLRVARVLARILYGHPGLVRFGFRRVGQTVCEAVARVIAGERSYRDLLGQPLNYARLLTAAATGDRRRRSASRSRAAPPA